MAASLYSAVAVAPRNGVRLGDGSAVGSAVLVGKVTGVGVPVGIEVMVGVGAEVAVWVGFGVESATSEVSVGFEAVLQPDITIRRKIRLKNIFFIDFYCRSLFFNS